MKILFNYYQQVDKQSDINGHFMFRYLELGKYDEQLAPYFDLFPKDNIQVIMYDELAAQYRKYMPKVIQHRVKTWLPNVIRKHGNQAFSPPPLSKEAQDILRIAYAPHMTRLEGMIGKILVEWRNRETNENDSIFKCRVKRSAGVF
ncbi:MAG: hypothetical protein Q9M28_11085 [Mariprofundaceae bacterium]|nr:hypothetical protein [Mariprofundaceae bacterium]